MSAETLVLDDAIFHSVGEIVRLNESGKLALSPLPANFLATEAQLVERIHGHCCILTSWSRPDMRLLCALPQQPVPSFSPLLLYHATLARVRSDHPRPLPSLDECIANKLVPEWQFVSRPIVQRTACDKAMLKLSFSQNIVSFMDNDKLDAVSSYLEPDTEESDKLVLVNGMAARMAHRLGGVFTAGTCGTTVFTSAPQEVALASLGIVEDTTGEACAASLATATRRRPQWLQLSQYVLPHVAASITMSSDYDHTVQARIDHIVRVMRTEPWLAFMDGLTDTDGLMRAIAQNNLQAELDSRLGDLDAVLGFSQNPTLFWHNACALYTNLVMAMANGPNCALPAPESVLAEALCRLGVLYREPNSGAITSRIAHISADWLVRFITLLVRVREAKAPACKAQSPLVALTTRDLLFVEVPLPLCAACQAEPNSRIAELRRVCVARLVPTDMPTNVAQFQDDFARRMADVALVDRPDVPLRFPVVLVEDLQFWSPHMLRFWLLALLNAPQRGQGFARHPDGAYVATGSPALFKLILCFSRDVEDVGARDILLPQATEPLLWPSNAFPSAAMSSAFLPKAKLIWGIVRALAVSRSDYAAECVRFEQHLYRSIQGESSAEQCVSVALGPLASDTFVVRNGAQSAIAQMASAGRLPRYLLSSNVSGMYRAEAEVALELPLDLRKLLTLLSLLDRVVLVAPSQ